MMWVSLQIHPSRREIVISEEIGLMKSTIRITNEKCTNYEYKRNIEVVEYTFMTKSIKSPSFSCLISESVFAHFRKFEKLGYASNSSEFLRTSRKQIREIHQRKRSKIPKDS